MSLFPPAPIWLLKRSDLPNAQTAIDAARDRRLLADDDGPPLRYTDTFASAQHAARNVGNFKQLADGITRHPLAGNQNNRYYTSLRACKLPSNCLHPLFYMECAGIRDLDTLADYLEVPSDWRARIDQVIYMPYTQHRWQVFRALGDDIREVCLLALCQASIK